MITKTETNYHLPIIWEVRVLAGERWDREGGEGIRGLVGSSGEISSGGADMRVEVWRMGA